MDIENGIKEAYLEAVVGVVVAALIASFTLILAGYSWIFWVITLASSIGLAYKLIRAEVTYLIGWLIGIWLLSGSGIFSALDLALYVILPFAGLIIGTIAKYYPRKK